MNILTISAYSLSIYIIIKSLKCNNILIILLIPYFYFFFAIQISLILIERGAYIYEQQIFGYPNDASFYLSIFFLVFSIVIYKSNFNNKISPHSVLFIKPIPKNHLFIFTVLLISMVVLDLILIRLYGFGTNRFDIYTGIPNKIHLVRLRQVILYLSIYYIIRGNSNYRILISLLLIMWGFIRFAVTSAFFPLLVPWSIVLTIENKKQQIPLTAYILGVCLIAIIFYLKMLELDAFFISRLVLTGHVFWGSINEMGNGDIYYQLNNYIDSFFNLGTFTTTEKFGNGYLMRLLSGSFADSYIEKGIRFSHGMPAILIVNFGIFVSLILYVLFLFVFFKWLIVYSRILLYSNVILYLFAERILYVLEEFMLIGEIGLIHFKFIIIVFLFLLLKDYFMQRRVGFYKYLGYNFAG